MVNKVLVDNKNVREVFSQMLYSSFQSKGPTRVLCLTARSGKGKSTIIDYFQEFCNECGTLSIRLDFDAFDTFKVSNEWELIDIVIDQFGHHPKYSGRFSRYRTAIEQLALRRAGDTIIQNVNLIQTQIGTIHIQKEPHESRLQLRFIEDAFFQDLKDIASKSDGKIVFLMDAFERVPKSVQKWFFSKFILSKALSPQIVFVIASQRDFEFSPQKDFTYGVKRFQLPDTYEFNDWIEYGKQLQITDIETIEKCYKCWKGEPFHMCIALKPFSGLGRT